MWKIVSAVRGTEWGKSASREAAQRKADWLNDGRTIPDDPKDIWIVVKSTE
jgi:hypothetical protein